MPNTSSESRPTLKDVLADGKSHPVVSELHLRRLNEEAVFEISDLPEESDGARLDHSQAGIYEVAFIPYDVVKGRDYTRLIGRIAALGKDVRIQLFIKDDCAHLKNISAQTSRNNIPKET